MRRVITNNLKFSLANFILRATNTLVVYALLARIFDLGKFGIISFMLTIVLMCVNFMDFGYRMMIVKGVSVSTDIVRADYIYPKLLTKGFLFIAIFSMVLVYFLLKPDWTIPVLYVVLFISTFLFIDLSNFFFSFFQAVNKFQLETVCLFAFTAGNLLGVVLAWMTGKVWAFLGAYMLGAFGMMLISGFYFLKYFSFPKERNILDYLANVRQEIKVVLPFALIVISDILLASIDTLFVEHYCTKEELGLYTGMVKIVAGLSIFAVILYSVFFPIVSKLTQTKKIKAARLIQLFVGISALGVIMYLGYYTFNEQLILLLLGEQFMEIKEYDFYLSLYTLARYLRIIPVIYLVCNGWEQKRVVINFIMIGFMVYYLALLVPVSGIKASIKVLSYVNFTSSVILALLFLLALYLDQKKISNAKSD